MEQYGLDELVASAEAVVAGLGPLAAGLARLAVEASRAVTLDAMEGLVIERGTGLLRGLVQLGLDAQADAEVRVAEVTGADGVSIGKRQLEQIAAAADVAAFHDGPANGQEPGPGAGRAARRGGRGRGAAAGAVGRWQASFRCRAAADREAADRHAGMLLLVTGERCGEERRVERRARPAGS